jgi:hypothetical protein
VWFSNKSVRPSSVTFGDTFSQREKALGLHRTKGFSLWEKLAAQRTDEGCGSPWRGMDFLNFHIVPRAIDNRPYGFRNFKISQIIKIPKPHMK